MHKAEQTIFYFRFLQEKLYVNYLFGFKMILKRKIDNFGGMAIALIKSFSFREFIIKLSMISSQQKPRTCPFRNDTTHNPFRKLEHEGTASLVF